jgi:hypothetical protein
MTDENGIGRSSIRDFLVDLLGGLVPGVVFTFLAMASIGWPTWAILREVQRSTPIDSKVLQQGAVVLQTFRFEIIAFFVVASYVTGHFLFRQDPKVPDRRSFLRASKTMDEREKKTWVVRPDGKEGLDIQFPYRYLKEYLEDRELKHLAGMVPWRGGDPSTHHKRTKSFLNILKIRLVFHFADRCGQITRNEAHIRLMSSIWYAGGALSKVAGLGSALLITTASIGYFTSQKTASHLFLPFIASALVLMIAIWAKITIERFLHYQRVREVIFVLETAFNASLERPSILEDLC